MTKTEIFQWFALIELIALLNIQGKFLNNDLRIEI